MKNLLTGAAALLVLGLCACSPSGDSAGGSAAALGEAECRAVYTHARQLQGIPDGVLVDAFEQGIADCASQGKLTQEAHDCVMAAASADALRACKVDLT